MQQMTLEAWYRALKQDPLYTSSIAMEAAPSLPVPVMSQRRLYAGVLVLRTKTEERGKVQIFRPEASLIVTLPEPRIARFSNFTLLDPHPQLPVDRPVDTFPHAAIAGWKLSRYKEVREAYFGALPAFGPYINSRGKEQQEEVQELVRTFLTIAEPGLLPHYLELSPLFAVLCIKARPALREALRELRGGAARSDQPPAPAPSAAAPGADDDDDPLAEISSIVRSHQD
jgi:hypothetical protein